VIQPKKQIVSGMVHKSLKILKKKVANLLEGDLLS